MTKRHLECIAATAGLVLLSPLFVLIALAIKLDDGGPVLFSQWRLGVGKKPFCIYKFRTMRNGWITDIGRALRATGLDELPQLANVLVGDMSLIGPRPLTADDVNRLGWSDEQHALRWSLRPGITGLAQIFAGRGARLSWFLDRHYVASSGFQMDAGVGALSIAICLVGKHRVRNSLRQYRRAACARRVQTSQSGTGRDWTPTGCEARLRH